MQNVGQKLELEGDEFALPKRANMGASGQFSYGTAGHALLSAQYDRPLVDGWDSDENGVLRIGTEMELSILGTISQLGRGESVPVRDLLAGRIGYVRDEDAQVEDFSYGFGVGLETDDRLMVRIDFANAPQPESLERTWRLQGSGWITF